MFLFNSQILTKSPLNKIVTISKEIGLNYTYFSCLLFSKSSMFSYDSQHMNSYKIATYKILNFLVCFFFTMLIHTKSPPCKIVSQEIRFEYAIKIVSVQCEFIQNRQLVRSCWNMQLFLNACKWRNRLFGSRWCSYSICQKGLTDPCYSVKP